MSKSINRHERRNRQTAKTKEHCNGGILKAPKWAAQAAIRGEIGIKQLT